MWRKINKIIFWVLALAGLGPAAFGLSAEKNIPYRSLEKGEFSGLRWNTCDLYHSPKPRGIVFLVHGGSWTVGDKNLDFIPEIATRLTAEGFSVVSPNYRLSPFARHPAHIEDTVKALAFIWKRLDNPKLPLVLLGHSAGGHLVALLAADPFRLVEAGVDPKIISGVVTVSGVFEGESFPVDPSVALLGTNQERLWPMKMAQAAMPPHLLIAAGEDLPSLAPQAERYAEKIRLAGTRSTFLLAKKRNHATVFWNLRLPGDPVFETVLTFLNEAARISD
ncbi:MAG: alpha/beta hydrolase [Spirochaetia bacterium]|nr:alpha/beta hydrolase [Spirochaetia bacterium]